MAVKGSKRGRGKRDEPEAGQEAGPDTEPTTSPEAALPPPEAGGNEFGGESEAHAGAGDPPFPQEREEAEPTWPPVPDEPTEPAMPDEPTGPRGPAAAAAWSASHLAIAGLVVVLVAAILGGVWVYGTAGDTDRLDRQARRLDALATQGEVEAGRLGAAEEAIAGLQSELSQVKTAVGELQSVAETNRQTLDRVAQGVEELRSSGNVSAEGTGTGEAVGELQASIGTLDQRVASLEQGGGLDDLTGRIARLEEEIVSLRDQAAERIGQAQSASALGRAYAALAERVAAGARFAGELEAVTAELPNAPGLETLRPLAGKGVPTVSDLKARLAGIAGGLPAAQPDDRAAADADGVWQTLRQRLRGMVTVRRAGEADWPAVVGRADEALQRGDIEAAIAEVEAANNAAPGGIEDWLADARARRDAQAALDELSDAVLRQFAGRQ